MKRFNSSCRGLPVLVALFALAGCSSNLSGPSGSSNTNSDAQLRTAGVISTHNGISVNGESIPLQSTVVSIDGEPASATSLQDGMQVSIQRQDGVIQSISYDEDIKGPVDIVELDGSLSVLGQTVLISPSTYFDDSTPGSLKSGDVIEVSGLRDSNDVLTASRIERKDSNTKSWSVLGQVRDLDRSLQIFVIGNLTVDYAQARFDDMSESSLKNGLQIEVKDDARTYEPGSLYLVATKIENHDLALRSPSSTSASSSSSGVGTNDLIVDDSSEGDDDDSQTDVEIVGIVTSFDIAAGTLNVEGIRITTSSATEYQNGNDQYITREDFFARLQQGVTVVQVKWRPFMGYDQAAHELEIES